MICWFKVGVGIVYVLLMWVIEEIKCGEVEVLFKKYYFDLWLVYVLYIEKDKMLFKVQVCIDYLIEYFKWVVEVY